jgi:cytochrome c-type biogenesis protein CcmH/NrfF
VQLGNKYQPFANPFFDQAGTYTPTSMKELFSYCRHFFLTHGLVNAIITRASEYPVTDLILESNDTAVTARYEEAVNDVLNYPSQQYAINLDQNVYGIAFVSMNFPFEKWLTCVRCKSQYEAKASRLHWRYTAGTFRLTCPKCRETNIAKSEDRTVKKLSELSIMRWNPERMSILENEVTGRCEYAFDPSPDFRQQIKYGRKDLVATTPELFLEAVRLNRQVALDPANVFVMRRPGLSQTMSGWGVPMMMPVLKDLYTMQIMKRTNEAVMLQHLVPQVFLFPQPATGGADPFVTASLATWRDSLRAELAHQRRDPAYYGILPFPIGHQVIGENGRSLLLLPELQEMARLTCIGMGFPPDLVFGSGSYAGSSVNMRMLENVFLTNVRQHKRLLHFILTKISTFMGWPAIKGRFKPFRMADDLQRQAFLFQLNMAKKISDSTLLSAVDLRVETETELMSREIAIRGPALKEVAAVEADIQSEAQITMAKAQVKSQEVMAESQARAMVPKPDPFMDAVSSLASTTPVELNTNIAMRGLAERVRGMPPDRQELFIAQLRDRSPDIGALMQQQMAAGGGPPGADPAAGQQPDAAQQPGAPPQGVDMRPMPEQLPPRRASLA